jgi:hypothetical protein
MPSEAPRQHPGRARPHERRGDEVEEPGLVEERAGGVAGDTADEAGRGEGDGDPPAAAPIPDAVPAAPAIGNCANAAAVRGAFGSLSQRSNSGPTG